MLAGNRLRELPESLANCRKLELLRIAANRIERFPEWLLSLPRLAWLAYSGNPFSEGAEARAISDEQVASLPWQRLAIGELLGQGAAGVIHRAVMRSEPLVAERMADESREGIGASEVAVKIFKGAVTSDGLPQCEMAASLAAGAHPNLIPVLGRVADHPSGMPALVMALIDPAFANLAGPPSLASCTRDVYDEGLRFTLAEALALALGIASVAGHLHQAGSMHGDLYGHNILFTRGPSAHALLGDFGAASLYDLHDRELAQGLERLEVRAFGCLLEELLARCDGDVDDAQLAGLHQLAAACLSELHGERPDFAEIGRQLAAAHSTLL